jgi:hypothetical protein
MLLWHSSLTTASRAGFSTSARFRQTPCLGHFLVWRARLPLILLDQERVIVAPQQELHELARAYVAQQRDFGNLEGQIVRTLDDAYLALDLKQPDFRPVLTATDYLSR